jgi:[acyl-carrier-protein] S-malonyltransferase
VAPGQGAQKPGFLAPWLELPDAKAKLAWWSQLAGIDLVRLGTEAAADEIKDTAKTQPLLVAAGLLAAGELPMDDVSVVAGHSIGELVAAQLAGVLSAEAAVGLAARRGAEMAAACAPTPTGMSALLGGDSEVVAQHIADAGLVAANHNSAGQVVAAGPLEGLAKLAENPPPRTRIIPLSVAGAFHTETMRPAQDSLEQIVAGITVGEPHKIMISNADGAAVHTGAGTLARLVAQLTLPVRWDLCQACLKDLGVTAIIELPPAGTLVGLARREFKGVELLAVNSPDDLVAARALIAHHGGSSSEPSQRFQLAVAGTAGIFEPAEIAEGDAVSKTTVIGVVRTRQGEVPVNAPGVGVLVEWLADPQDPVAAGQPLARLHTEADYLDSLADSSALRTAA